MKAEMKFGVCWILHIPAGGATPGQDGGQETTVTPMTTAAPQPLSPHF